MSTLPKRLSMTAVILLWLPSCSPSTSTDFKVAVPKGVGYCQVAKPIPNSHACPATVQDGVNEANAIFFTLCGAGS